MSRCAFEIFGIRIQHKSDWRILPEHAMNFDADCGFVRFEENIRNKVSGISLGLRWEKTLTTNEVFMSEFSEKIKEECKKKLKNKKDDFRVLEESIIENNSGQKMCYIVTQYRATQGLVKNDSKMTALRIINAAYYCEQSNRMIICSLITTPQRCEEEKELFMNVITSIHSKAPFEPEEMAVREEERARVRANMKAQNEKGRFGLKKIKKSKEADA